MLSGRPQTAIRVFASVLLLCAAFAGLGCGSNDAQPRKPTGIPSPHAPLPPAQNLPEFMKGTIHEHAIVLDAEPMAVSGFGLVVGLRGTGDSTVPLVVRDYIIKDMVKRGVGKPEAILADPRVAIVVVEGSMPPGIRAGEQFDVHVAAMPESTVSSLAHGRLYLTELSPNGANLLSPGNPVHKYARAQGEIFVNPGYAFADPASSPNALSSLRFGAILNGGQAMVDRPMRLRLRQPQASLARYIERRLDERFQNRDIAQAKDEAIIQFVVPPAYGRDWEHFMNVVTHLYLDAGPQRAPYLAQRLAEEAVKPDALLMDISYCLEGLGQAAIPAIHPLLTHPQPDVAYAAARAGAFLGDQPSIAALMQMASNDRNPFQLNAVEALGKLPYSPMLATMLRRLLDSEQALVRVEAYRTLARHRDPTIYSRVIRERYVVDIVPSNAPPIIYCSRTGIPRIAVIGNAPRIDVPIVFTQMGNRFMISSTPEGMLTLFYRGPDVRQPISILSRPDVAEVAARLGGEGAEGESRLDFSYSEVVAILQSLVDQGKLVASHGPARQLAMLVLEDVSHMHSEVYSAPVISAQVQTPGSMSADDLPMLQGDVTDDARISGQGLGTRPQ